MALLLETGIDEAMLRDIPGMRTYLLQMNDQLRYLFNHLTPEENFSPYAVNEYVELDDLSSSFEKNEDTFGIHFEESSEELSAGIRQAREEINLYVTAGDVTNQLNIRPEEILIQGQLLNIQTDNFMLDTEGNLDFKGTVISRSGKIGGFEIATDAEGKLYLRGTADSTITAGEITGATGKFRKFVCREEISMQDQTWTMFGCDIRSSGLRFTAGFATGDVDIARYSDSSGEYTAWYALTCKEKIYVTGDCRVGKNGDDSGTVRCLSIYSYFEGEKPDPNGEETSDRRAKKNLRKIDGTNACCFLNRLRPVEYCMKEDKLRQLGLIAQEVKAAEEQVQTDFGLAAQAENGFFSLHYMAFVPIITAAVQEIEQELWQLSQKTV